VARIRANIDALGVVERLRVEGGRAATPAEQAVLARWSGWGAVPEVFDEARAQFAAARVELRHLLGNEGYAAAARNTLNAHYTDAALVSAIWAVVGDLGFTAGRVLEPTCRASVERQCSQRYENDSAVMGDRSPATGPVIAPGAERLAWLTRSQTLCRRNP